jgi:hypothetical protein
VGCGKSRFEIKKRANGYRYIGTSSTMMSMKFISVLCLEASHFNDGGASHFHDGGAFHSKRTLILVGNSFLLLKNNRLLNFIL